MKWQITRDKFLSKEERDRLMRATEEKAIVDLALFSGLRVFEVAALTIVDLRLNGSEKLIYIRKGGLTQQKSIFRHRILEDLDIK